MEPGARPGTCLDPSCTPRDTKRSVLVMTLLCGAHCSLALLVPLLAIALTAAGAYLKLPLIWIAPPVAIAAAFLYLIWPSIQSSWAKLRQGPQPTPSVPSFQEIQA